MTNSESEPTSSPNGSEAGTSGIDDDLLPEDLRPSGDNPLAEPLGDADNVHSPDELDMEGGKVPVESEGPAGPEGSEGSGGPEGSEGSGGPDDASD